MNIEATIPAGWCRVTEGYSRPGDKYWNGELEAWLPVPQGESYSIQYYEAVIRRKGQIESCVGAVDSSVTGAKIT